jgi:N-acetylglucosaminyldiphosphoundecaprenol N-acetyl-beta-D-mannosaminyltransferase
MYLLGGEPDANARAATVLRERWPAIKMAGYSSPTVSSPPSVSEVERLRVELVQARPDLLLVGMGSPKQELVTRALLPHLPGCWMLGVGGSFSLVAGKLRRAPRWMQRAGLEWVWRLAQEPRRLARRYLVDDLPFSIELFGRAFLKRVGDRLRP